MSLQRVVNKILARRARFPKWVNRMIDFVVDNPPNFLWQRLSPFAKQALPEEIPAALYVPMSQPERIVIGPLNYSAQGFQWARAIEQARPQVWARNFSIEVPGGFSFPTDLEVPMHVHASSSQWQQQMYSTLQQTTHVLIEAQRPLLGKFFTNFEVEARALLNQNIAVACIAHGTDVRVPSEHLGTTPWSLYHDPNYYAGRDETLAKRNRESMRRLTVPLFVSTPDLLHFLPEAQWCPVVVKEDIWRTSAPLGERKLLVVTHAPSVAKIKGTDLIEPILERLHDANIIEYRPIRGVPSAQMPSFYAETDLVLDQFRLGSYGVAACEAMSAGRVVLGHVTERVRNEIQRQTGHKLPIVEATPATLEGMLMHFSTHRNDLGEIAKAGVDFVSAVHDGRKSAQVLSEHWLDHNHKEKKRNED